MEDDFLKNFCKFCIDNFSFNPENLREEKNILSSTKTFNFHSLRIEKLNYPKNRELSNLFLYYSLFLLVKTDDTFKKNNKKLIKSILSYIYEFHKKEFDAKDLFNDLEYTFPFKNSEIFKNCFEKKEDFNSFLIFNLLLVLCNHNEICEEHFINKNFEILNILLLYNYIFIHNSINEFKIKNIISILIIKFIDYYTKTFTSDQNNDVIILLNTFFFDEGKINQDDFLIPENIYNEFGCKEFNCIIDVFSKNIKEGDNISIKLEKSILDNLNNIKRKKFIKEEHNEINNLIEENNKSVNTIFELKRDITKIIDEKKVMKNHLLELIEKNKRDVELKLNIQEQTIIELKQIINFQSNAINEQEQIIGELNKLIINQENNIKELNKQLFYNKYTIKENDDMKNKETNNNSNNTLVKDNKIIINEAKNNRDFENKIICEQIIKLNKDLNDLKKYVKKDGAEIKKLRINLNDYKTENKMKSNIKDLMSSREFLQSVFHDFCFYFKTDFSGNYSQTAKFLVTAIQKKTEIQKFVKEVNLINFILFLGRIIDETSNMSQILFPPLSIKKEKNEEKNIEQEKIKNSINRCMKAFNEYCRNDFSLLFEFLINDYNYPFYILDNSNNIPKEKENYLFEVINNYKYQK